MPTPTANESKEEWISRCMASEESRKTFPDPKQRAAFCYSKWEQKNKKKAKNKKGKN